MEKYKVLFEKLKLLVLKPKDSWVAIAQEEMTSSYLMKDVLITTAVASALGQFLGRWMIGTPLPSVVGGGVVRLTFAESLISALVITALQVVGVWAFAKVINYLAPRFDGTADEIRALKLAVFTSAPVLLAGILYIIPSLGIVVFLLSLYCLYLLFAGLPVLMQAPKEKSLPYGVVAIAAMILIMIIVSAISTPILANFGDNFRAF